MNKKLYETLCKLKAITEGTIVKVEGSKRLFDNTTTKIDIDLMIEEPKEDYVLCANRNGKLFKIKTEKIKEINGMSVERYAESYDLHDNGVVARKEFPDGSYYLYDKEGNQIGNLHKPMGRPRKNPKEINEVLSAS